MDQIEIHPYDPHWPRRFREEASRIDAALGELSLTIEHVGSTSVPGLVAKPVIDIMVGLHNFDRGQDVVVALERLGYAHWREDPAKPERLYFVL